MSRSEKMGVVDFPALGGEDNDPLFFKNNNNSQ